MNFEQFSKKYQKIESPISDGTMQKSSGKETPDLLKSLRKEDLRSKKISKKFYIIYVVGIILYLLIFIVNPDADLTIKNRISGTCFVISFAILGFLFRKKIIEIDNSNYLKSPKQFLINARKRYSFWNKKQLWLILVIFLINIGASLSISKYYGNLDPLVATGIFQFIFWVIMIYGFFMGKKEWEKNKKHFFIEIDKMLAGFED